ncbi:MAG: TonB-dependent receptor [Thiobacillus sp.]|nr:TonB-dependent receptor [Thiobacillus sp.]
MTLLLGSIFVSPERALAVSETDFLDDLPVVLSASRLSQPVSDAPTAVTLIDQDMIRASGFRDIPELLRLVPGFSVAYTGDNTWTAGYHGLADAYSRRFQVLVDGRSIYSPHYGTVHWTDLPLSIDDIERIEVVRGPNAAIHGANAFVAVINIITKTAAQVPGEYVALQAGEQDLRGLTVRHGGGTGGVHYRLTASAQQRDRFERDVNFKTSADNGQYFEASKTYFVNGRMDWQVSRDSDAMVQFGVSRGDWEGGSRTASASTVLEPIDQDSRALYLQLAYHKVESEQREWRLQVYHTQNHFDADAAGNVGVNVVVDQYLMQSRTNIELQVNEQWSPALRAVWGGEIRQESVKSPQSYNSSKTFKGELARMFANLEWRPADRLLLQGGAMLEHHYFTGGDISPRVAANFTLAPGHVVRLGLSRAYRSPTFFEEQGNQVFVQDTGQVVDVFTVPSMGLAPERILSREIGYVGYWRPAHVEFDVRLFRDKINNFIGQQKADFDTSVSGTEFRYENLGTVRSQGGEFQVRWRPSMALDVSAHYARVFLTADTRRQNYNVDIPQSAPRNNVGLLVNYRPAPGWETGVGVWRTDAVIWLTEGDITRPYTRVDARVAKRWKWQGREVEAVLVGQNLGEDYQEFRDTNRFSRRVYGSLSFAW